MSKVLLLNQVYFDVFGFTAAPARQFAEVEYIANGKPKTRQFWGTDALNAIEQYNAQCKADNNDIASLLKDGEQIECVNGRINCWKCEKPKKTLRRRGQSLECGTCSHRETRAINTREMWGKGRRGY